MTKNGVKRNSRAHKEPSISQQPVLEGATKEAINQKEPYEGPSGGARNRDGDPVAMKKMVLWTDEYMCKIRMLVQTAYCT